jgi:hypothetical protein
MAEHSPKKAKSSAAKMNFAIWRFSFMCSIFITPILGQKANTSVETSAIRPSDLWHCKFVLFPKEKISIYRKQYESLEDNERKATRLK